MTQPSLTASWHRMVDPSASAWTSRRPPICLQEDNDWMSVNTELHEVVGSSMMGKKLFGCGVAKVLARQAQTDMEEGISNVWELNGQYQ